MSINGLVILTFVAIIMLSDSYKSQLVDWRFSKTCTYAGE
jgi:hypothetical protein